MSANFDFKGFRADFAKAVEGLEKKYSIKIELGNISYSDIAFHSKLTCTKLSSTGEKEVDLEEFNLLKSLLGFTGNIGDSYTGHDGKTYTVTGLNSKARKAPVMLKCSDGKSYKSSVFMVNLLLKEKSAQLKLV